MNLHLNLRNLRSSWLVTRLRSLALALAFFGAGGWSLPALSDTVVWDTGPFCADCVTTNITFVSLAQFDSFTNYVYVRIWDAYGSLDQVTNFISLCESDLWLADSNLQAALDASSNVPFLTVLRIREARYAITNSADSTGLNVGAIGRLNKATEYATRASSDLQQVTGAFYNGVDTTRAQVATACESSGGCVCECPDYTSILNSINSNLAAIRVDVNSIWGEFDEIYFWLSGSGDDAILPSLYNFGWGVSGALGYDLPVDGFYTFGDFLASTYSNSYSVAKSLRTYFQDVNPYTRDLTGGDSIAHNFADALTLFQQLYYADDGGYLDNPIIEGERDFWLSRNVHPTNTSDNALWVRGSGTNGSISVSGKVDFDESALRDLLQEIEFKVINGISDFHVVVDNTNDFLSVGGSERIYSEVQNNFTTIENIASEVEGQAAEYQAPTWTLDDFSTRFDFKQNMENLDFVGKWSSMFNSIHPEMPALVKIFDGYSPNNGNPSGNPGPWGGWSQIADADIGSLFWNPAETSGTLIRAIRGIFRALWTLIILIMIVHLLKINWLLARCGCRICVQTVAAFGSTDPLSAIVATFEETVKALGQLYTGLLGGKTVEDE